MSQDLRKWIHRIYGIALSAVTVIAGIRLILACYGIYTEGKAAGGQIYTRAIVAEAFAPIAVPVYLCLVLVIGGFILHLALPLESKKPALEKNRQLILDRLYAKTDLTQCDSTLRADIEKQQKTRKLHLLISAVLLAACCVGFLAYACQPNRWPEVGQVTGAMIPAVLVLAGCLVIPTGYCIFTAYFCHHSMDREIELMKQASKESPASPAPKAEKAINQCKWMPMVRCAIIVVALVLMIYGYASGGIEDVIAKAAAICTECVGLG